MVNKLFQFVFVCDEPFVVAPHGPNVQPRWPWSDWYRRHVQRHARDLARDTRDAAHQDKARAEADARWLADRDGIALEVDDRADCETAIVPDGARRIRRVAFKRYESGARSRLTVALIDPPNWDFTPSLHIATARAA